MGSNEYDSRPVGLSCKRPRDAEPVNLGHGHVEQDKIGIERFDQAQGRGAIAGRPHHLQCRYPRAQDLHPLDSQRFIVNNQRAQLKSPQHSFRTTGMVSTVA